MSPQYLLTSKIKCRKDKFPTPNTTNRYFHLSQREVRCTKFASATDFEIEIIFLSELGLLKHKAVFDISSPEKVMISK